MQKRKIGELLPVRSILYGEDQSKASAQLRKILANLPSAPDALLGRPEMLAPLAQWGLNNPSFGPEKLLSEFSAFAGNEKKAQLHCISAALASSLVVLPEISRREIWGSASQEEKMQVGKNFAYASYFMLKQQKRPPEKSQAHAWLQQALGFLTAAITTGTSWHQNQEASQSFLAVLNLLLMENSRLSPRELTGAGQKPGEQLLGGSIIKKTVSVGSVSSLALPPELDLRLHLGGTAKLPYYSSHRVGLGEVLENPENIDTPSDKLYVEGERYSISIPALQALHSLLSVGYYDLNESEALSFFLDLWPKRNLGLLETWTRDFFSSNGLPSRAALPLDRGSAELFATWALEKQLGEKNYARIFLAHREIREAYSHLLMLRYYQYAQDRAASSGDSEAEAQALRAAGLMGGELLGDALNIFAPTKPKADAANRLAWESLSGILASPGLQSAKARLVLGTPSEGKSYSSFTLSIVNHPKFTAPDTAFDVTLTNTIMAALSYLGDINLYNVPGEQLRFKISVQGGFFVPYSGSTVRFGTYYHAGRAFSGQQGNPAKPYFLGSAEALLSGTLSLSEKSSLAIGLKFLPPPALIFEIMRASSPDASIRSEFAGRIRGAAPQFDSYMPSMPLFAAYQLYLNSGRNFMLGVGTSALLSSATLHNFSAGISLKEGRITSRIFGLNLAGPKFDGSIDVTVGGPLGFNFKKPIENPVLASFKLGANLDEVIGQNVELYLKGAMQFFPATRAGNVASVNFGANYTLQNILPGLP